MQPVYIVLIINLIIWAGIFGFMFNTDKKISALSAKLERLNKDKEN